MAEARASTSATCAWRRFLTTLPEGRWPLKVSTSLDLPGHEARVSNHVQAQQPPSFLGRGDDASVFATRVGGLPHECRVRRRKRERALVEPDVVLEAGAAVSAEFERPSALQRIPQSTLCKIPDTTPLLTSTIAESTSTRGRPCKRYG